MYATIPSAIESLKDTAVDLLSLADVPVNAYKDIKAGWIKYYWEQIKKYLER